MGLNVKEKLISVLSIVMIVLLFTMGFFLYENIAAKFEETLTKNLYERLSFSLNLINYTSKISMEKIDTFIKYLSNMEKDEDILKSCVKGEKNSEIKVMLYLKENSSYKLISYNENADLKQVPNIELVGFEKEILDGEKFRRFRIGKDWYLEKFLSIDLGEKIYLFRILLKEIQEKELDMIFNDFKRDTDIIIDFLSLNENPVKRSSVFTGNEYSKIKENLLGLKGKFLIGELEKKKIIVYEYSDFLNMYVLTTVNYDIFISSKLNIIKDTLVIFYILGIIIAFPLFSMIIKSTLTPLEDIVEGFEEILKGNLDVRLKVRRKDEIGEVANEFNNFIKKLQENFDERKKLESELEKKVKYDELTGALSRREIFEKLEDLYEEAKYYGKNFEIVYIDLDGLKYINDKFGHSEGDFYIVNFANIVKKNIDVGEYFARIGGDEFLIVFEEKQIDELKRKILEIKTDFFNLKIKESKIYNMDFSYGFAEYDFRSDQTIDELIEIADNKMYENKIKKSKG